MDSFDLFKPAEQEKALESLTEGTSLGGYIPDLKLCTGTSKAVQSGQATVRDLVLNGKVLGKEVKVMVGPFRPRAMVWRNGQKVQDSFDQNSEEFREIKEKAKEWAKGYSAGPEYLCWVVDAEEFAVVSFFRSNLGTAVDFHKYSGQVCTLTSKIVNGKNNTYPVFVVRATDTPEDIRLPSAQEQKEAYDLFMRPLMTSESAVAER